MPPIPIPLGIPPPAFDSSFTVGSAIIIASVVIIKDATEAASINAVLTTLVGSIIPALNAAFTDPVLLIQGNKI